MSFAPGRSRAIHDARRALGRFFVALPCLAVVPLSLRLRWGGPAHPGFDFGCLVAIEWMPALASVIALWPALPFGLGLRPPRSLVAGCFALALFAPLAIAALSYGLAWRLGLAPLAPPPAPGWAHGNVWGAMAQSVGEHFSHRWGYWLLLAVGEEIGWRGFLSLQLKRADLPLAMLIGGLAWSAWHWPPILWGHYPAGPDRLLSAVLLTVTLTAFTYLLGAMRLATASVWTPAFAHALWNSLFFDSFAAATPGVSVWTHETGILTAAASIVVTLLSLAMLGPAMRAGGLEGGARPSYS